MDFPVDTSSALETDNFLHQNVACLRILFNQPTLRSRVDPASMLHKCGRLQSKIPHSPIRAFRSTLMERDPPNPVNLCAKICAFYVRDEIIGLTQKTKGWDCLRKTRRGGCFPRRISRNVSTHFLHPEDWSRTYLPPPEGAGEFMACTMSVVRASNKLVMNSTFFPSGHPGVNQRQEKYTKISFHY